MDVVQDNAVEQQEFCLYSRHLYCVLSLLLRVRDGKGYQGIQKFRIYNDCHWKVLIWTCPSIRLNVHPSMGHVWVPSEFFPWNLNKAVEFHFHVQHGFQQISYNLYHWTHSESYTEYIYIYTYNNMYLINIYIYISYIYILYTYIILIYTYIYIFVFDIYIYNNYGSVRFPGPQIWGVW